MTSSTKSSAGPSPTGSTTSPTTRDGVGRRHGRHRQLRCRGGPALGGTPWARPRFPKATKLLITPMPGGPTDIGVRLWKLELAKFAKETGLEVTVCHYPPGTSKWNKIEPPYVSATFHELGGRPLVSYRTIIELISATTTASGLTIRAAEDRNFYGPAPRSVTPSLRRCRSTATSSTATGTTRSLNQTLGEP